MISLRKEDLSLLAAAAIVMAGVAWAQFGARAVTQPDPG